MKTASRDPKPMTGEGAAVEFLGEGFPPGAAAEMPVWLGKLNNPPKEQPRVKVQPVEQISDVVVQSAFALVEDEMLEDETRFAQAAEQPPVATVGAAVNAMDKVCRVHRDAARAGFRIIIEVEKEPDAFA